MLCNSNIPLNIMISCSTLTLDNSIYARFYLDSNFKHMTCTEISIAIFYCNIPKAHDNQVYFRIPDIKTSMF